MSSGMAMVEWEAIEQGLMMRSGSRCEIQSTACLGQTIMLAPSTRINGHIGHLPRWRRSLHHRRPRGMGGTSRDDVHSYAALINACGDGVTGCHGYVESNREWARSRGLLVPNNGTGDAVDPASVPLVLPSGRRVMLDDVGPFYLPPTDGIPYIV